jgi:isopentenyl diphosphate isomerase/L-lactate dehydrogenase-like FMN-dependent dehydrogenase
VDARRNEEAYRRLVLRPRVLVDVGAVSPAIELLGHTLSMPVLVAPTAHVAAAR